MTSQVIVNPDDLEQFARDLKKFSDELKQSSARIRGQFSKVGNTWRDQEHQKFAAEFEQTMRTLNRFFQTTDQHVPFLLRKAGAARGFLQQR